MARGKRVGRKAKANKVSEAGAGEDEPALDNMADEQMEEGAELPDVDVGDEGEHGEGEAENAGELEVNLETEADQNVDETEEFEAEANDDNDNGVAAADDAQLLSDSEKTGDEKSGSAQEETPMETQESAPAKAEEEENKEQNGSTEKTEESTPSEEKKEEKDADKEEEEPKKEQVVEKKEKKKKKERTKPYELEKYWKAVKTNPADFTGWTYLLQFVEQEDYMPFYREAFDAFFEHYPYCYGYWKKYADTERKKGSMDKCWQVFERGLKAIHLSTDLWLHFISVSSQNIPRTDPDRADRLRVLYEKAIDAAGLDFRSDKLWDQYITFEKKDQKDWKRVMQIYDRILKIPTQLYRHHFDKLKEFVQAHLPKEYLDFDEFLSLREQVVAEADPVETADDDDAGVPGEDAPPGEEAPPGLEAPPGVSSAPPKVIEGENKLIQEKVIESRRAIFRKTEQEVSKRWAYEEAIRRPYFHAKPLEKGQLKTWREYLEFEESTGSHDRTVLLYERCLIACALYEEFWLKYAKYMEKTSQEAASAIFKRACTVHLPAKPAINIQWAAFEEKSGNVEAAKDIMERLQTKQQDSVMIRLERINFERRQGNHDEVVRLYEGCIDDAKTATGQSFFASKLARFHQKVKGDHDSAIKVLEKVLEQKQVSPVLREQIYTQMLDVEYQRSPLNEEKMTEIFDAVINSGLPQDVKIHFAQRKIQFLQDFGMNPAGTHDAVDEHQRLVKNISSGKKRSADASGDAGTTSTPVASSETKAPEKKKAKTTPSPAPNNTGGNAQDSGYNNNYNYQQQQGGQANQAQGGGGGNMANYPTSWSSWASWGNFQQ